MERGSDSRAWAAWIDWRDPAAAARALREAGPSGVRRAPCKGWSPAVRKRFRLAAAEIDFSFRKKARWLLVTLTYPGDLSTLAHKVGCPWSLLDRTSVCTCRELWAEHLEAFALRWERRFGERPFALWAKEFQRRGVVHFHLCVLWPPRAELWRLRRWLSRVWYEVVGSRDERHFLAGTNAKAADSHHGVTEYLNRELGKARQKTLPAGLEEPGRMWGIWGLPRERADVRLTEREFHVLRRAIAGVVRAWMRAYAAELRAKGRRLVRRALLRYFGRYALAGAPWRDRRDWRLFLDVQRYLELLRGGAPPRPLRVPRSLVGRRRRTAHRRWRW